MISAPSKCNVLSSTISIIDTIDSKNYHALQIEFNSDIDRMNFVNILIVNEMHCMFDGKFSKTVLIPLGAEDYSEFLQKLEKLIGFPFSTETKIHAELPIDEPLSPSRRRLR